jgi:hypothetical protein
MTIKDHLVNGVEGIFKHYTEGKSILFGFNSQILQSMQFNDKQCAICSQLTFPIIGHLSQECRYTNDF